MGGSSLWLSRKILLGLLALQILVIGGLPVDELPIGGEVKDPVTHRLDELMVVGGHQHVAFHRLQALVQGGDGLQVQVVGGCLLYTSRCV